MTDLHDLLERATDFIEPPDLAAGALAEARRRRTRSRGVASGLVAAAAVLVLIVSVRVVTGDPRSDAPPAGPASPTATAVRVADRWDPRDVDRLPAAPASVAPLLPAVLEPPASVTRLAESPIAAAVLSVERGGQVLMLATDGTWRAVTCDNGTLSRDGTRLVVDEGGGTAQVWDLATGTWTTEARWPAGRPGAEPRTVGGLDFPVLGDGAVAGTTWDDGGLRVVAATRADHEPFAVQPIRDPAGDYGTWGLRPIAVLDDDTVLVRVGVPGGDAVDGWRVVAWRPADGGLSLVMRSDASATETVSFAQGLL